MKAIALVGELERSQAPEIQQTSVVKEMQCGRDMWPLWYAYRLREEIVRLAISSQHGAAICRKISYPKTQGE